MPRRVLRAPNFRRRLIAKRVHSPPQRITCGEKLGGPMQEIHSRRGSLALSIVGVISVVCAIGTLMLYVISSWGANSTVDHLLQLSLLVSAAVGLYLLLVGLHNLGVQPHLRLRRASRD